MSYRLNPLAYDLTVRLIHQAVVAHASQEDIHPDLFCKISRLVRIWQLNVYSPLCRGYCQHRRVCVKCS